jgi:hypothetical protein
VAARKEMDPIGFIFLGTVTGIGGGTFRDLVRWGWRCFPSPGRRNPLSLATIPWCRSSWG